MRILAVDDHPPTLEFLDIYLGRHGYDVLTAASGTEALSLLDRQGVDLVVLDLGLPDIDGLAVCRELRRRPGYLPVLMLTARDTVADELSGFAAAADDYLRKPVLPEVLLARVRALERRAVTRDVLRLVEGFELDLAMRELRRAGERVRLTPRSFDVLRFLCEHPGRLWSKNQLLFHVWGADGPADPSAVEWHVARIREALGDSGREFRFVLTRPHEGYVMPREVVLS
ncbi:MAG TPA: response regulator transcription factor [Mycobacteriales bacterium]|nr:response regulator transcription factor [Mycobacteriales bacterium]